MNSHCNVIKYNLEKLCKKGLENIDKKRKIKAREHLLEFQKKYNKKIWWKKLLYSLMLENISEEEAHLIIMYRKENGSTWSQIEHIHYPSFKYVWQENEQTILKLLSLCNLSFADIVISAEDAGHLMTVVDWKEEDENLSY